MQGKETATCLSSYWVHPEVADVRDLGWGDLKEGLVRFTLRRGKESLEGNYGGKAFYCKDKIVALVTKTLLENGALVCQLRVVPEIASVGIPREVIENVLKWVATELDGDELCRQVDEVCRRVGVGGDCRRAVGLLVYLLREGWMRM